MRRRLVQTAIIGRGDTTFLARYSQRRGGARAGVARARPSLPRATASRKFERGKRSRDREISRNSSGATREQGSEILARESSKDLVYMYIYICMYGHTYMYVCMYVWSSHIAEYGSTGQGCQSCSWSAEQGK